MFPSKLYADFALASSDASKRYHVMAGGIAKAEFFPHIFFSDFINNISRVITYPFHLNADDMHLYRYCNFDDLHVSRIK